MPWIIGINDDGFSVATAWVPLWKTLYVGEPSGAVVRNRIPIRWNLGLNHVLSCRTLNKVVHPTLPQFTEHQV